PTFAWRVHVGPYTRWPRIWCSGQSTGRAGRPAMPARFSTSRPRATLARQTMPVFVPVGRGPFVGRTSELSSLAQAVAESRSVRACVVMLAGEPGIGKSRLLEEFPPAALATRVIMLRGGCSDAQGMPPYLPFLEALGAYVAATPEDQLRVDA